MLGDKEKISSTTDVQRHKRARCESEDGVCSSKGQSSADKSLGFCSGNSDGNSDLLQKFKVTSDILPHTFRLFRVPGLPSWANTSCVSIQDVIQGDVCVAILSNYLVDVDWLVSACPTLKKVPHVLVVHGEGDGVLNHMERSKPANWILHKPPLPIPYGTHHSKVMILVYPRGIRIVVHTANLIHIDWNNKSQGLWLQDFPRKDDNGPNKQCAFECDLVDYLFTLKWPDFAVTLPLFGNINLTPSFFKNFDYSAATVKLIASVPGYHSGKNAKKWGHMKLRSLLQDSVFDSQFCGAPLAYQFSSLGSLDEKWMNELTTSMSSGFSEDKTPLGLGEPLIVWPTVEDVRCSLEGYAAGNSIPSPQKNIDKTFLKKYWAKWQATHTGRGRAMPHIKTYTRYSGQDLAWLLLTSANLSKAAWGVLQKNNSQLMIRSYEMGVLFLPSSLKAEHHNHGFSCTDSRCSSSEEERGEQAAVKTKLATLAAAAAGGVVERGEITVQLPLPYLLPLQTYSSHDEPWCWEKRYAKKDVYGDIWPR